MEEDVKETNPVESGKAEGEEKSGGFTSSAEAKMVMYVIPVAIVFIIAALILSRCSGG